jgi:hypothetical protein
MPDGIARPAGRVTLRQRVTLLGPTGENAMFILLILALPTLGFGPIGLKTKRIGQKDSLLAASGTKADGRLK